MTDKKATTGRWAEPPPARSTAYPWTEIAALLRKNPGKWRKVFDKDRTSLTIAIRNGNIAALRPDDGFELRTSNNVKGPPRTCSLFMRYVPPGEDK